MKLMLAISFLYLVAVAAAPVRAAVVWAGDVGTRPYFGLSATSTDTLSGADDGENLPDGFRIFTLPDQVWQDAAAGVQRDGQGIVFVSGSRAFTLTQQSDLIVGLGVGGTWMAGPQATSEATVIGEFQAFISPGGFGNVVYPFDFSSAHSGSFGFSGSTVVKDVAPGAYELFLTGTIGLSQSVAGGSVTLAFPNSLVASVTPVPLPAAGLMLGAGLLGLAAVGKARRRG